jgi:hypothetical protein
MATVVLSYAGAALGTALGGPIGGIIGRAIGGIAGNAIDQRLFGQKRRSEGPRLGDLRVMASEEGAAIPAVWGRMRVAGQVIWATNIEEVASTQTQKASSKGAPKAKTTSYSYFGSFAVGLGEGEIDGIGRVWADGKVIDLDQFTTRLYTGSEAQVADSLIASVEGTAPAYRGVAYIVFERLPLEKFGNRLPQLSFEVFRRGSSLGTKIKAVNIIPGSTEFGYDTTLVTRSGGVGKTISENAHSSAERSDWSVSMDQLQAACPNLESASLVVSWFGNDLRCGSCTVRPKVENSSKVTTGTSWGVSGLTRSTAQVVSVSAGAAAYGGSPSDASVVRAVQDLNARGIATTFYPFVMMDIPLGNGLPDPYGGAEQQPYPWRGRITCSIAPGRAGTPDKTAAVTAQVNAFMGNATPAQFSVNGTIVTYTGPTDWGYRHMILHYAKLCAAAGGVEAFLIGSELRGLTTLRNAATNYPFVAALQQLAADVKGILPAAKVSYAADWSEYFGHQPADGTNDVFFHLDPLWASASIDFIGIDNYMPLADWRDGRTHLDLLAGVGSTYDRNYLSSNITAGEGFDWFYASNAARSAQTRTPIADGAYAKPWVFRFKDLKSWWLNGHRNRPGGVEQGVNTAWVPQSKPVWFTEAGCPAVDKGANQPNVFYDPKSSESALPYFSGGQRDDLMQHRFTEVMLDYWGVAGAHNPVSSVYGQTMLRTSRTAWWAWDARPYPAFPARTDVWADGENYARGHWLNGRLSSVSLAELIVALAARYGLDAVDVSEVAGLVDGFVVDRPMSGRDALETLLSVFSLDAVESDGVLKFRPRAQRVVQTVAKDDLVENARDLSVMQVTRAQETDLPRAIRLGYVVSSIDYRSAAVQQQRTDTSSAREISLQLPAAVSQSLAQARADVALAESWSQRATASFSLPPSLLALEPGDVIDIAGQGYRLSQVTDAEARVVDAVLHDASVYDVSAMVERTSLPKLVDVFGAPDVVLMDLAVSTTAQPAAPWIAAQASPWPGRLNVLKQSGSSFVFNTQVAAQATMGTTLTALPAGLVGRVDFGASLDVVLDHGALSSVSKAELLDGANVAVIGSDATGFEVVQFLSATLVAANTYRLRGLLRAQAGSAAEMVSSRAAGERFVLLNGAVGQVAGAAVEASTWRVGPETQDHGHPSYVSLDLPPTLKGLRPLRPAHVKARRDASGVTINWIRQTRVGGDAWDVVEVPLSEESESYALQVMNGANAVRSWTVSSPQRTYTNAEMAADFGAVPSSLTLRVAQLSAAVGAGPFLERTLNV